MMELSRFTVTAIGFSVALSALAACQTVSAPSPSDARFCETSVFTVRADFAGGGMADCDVISDDHISVSIQPEDRPINPSPWYAVKLTPQTGVSQPVTVTFDYDDYGHRYWPKISHNGEDFAPIAADDISIREEGSRAQITLTPHTDGSYLAGQPIISTQRTRDWMEQIATRHYVSKSVIGQSIDGQDIHLLETASKGRSGSLMLISRQHPPEVTGALAYNAFVEELLSDTALANAFRETYQIVMVPLVNPDGVDAGYWRHNKGGLDLNRDWGPFTQPETQALKGVIDRLDESSETRPVVFLDFHSTRRNVFYTQKEGEDGTEEDLTTLWLTFAENQLSDTQYDFSRQGSHQADLPTSKTYMHTRFNIPAVTYEVGDETPPHQIAQSARVFARALMRTM